jgi:DNA-binding transcriptional regulator GbsR (MarR family)
MEVSTIPMQVDLRVHDDVALGEMELFGELLATVAASDRRLSTSEIDEALGLS